MNEPRSVR